MHIFKPRLTVTTFTSGAKGGVGKSTIVANFAALLDVPTAIIDLGVDGGTTVSMLHRVVTDSSYPGLLDFIVLGRDFEIQESKLCRNVYIIPPGNVRSVRLPLLLAQCRDVVKSRLERVLSRLYKLGVQVILIDLPSNAELLHILYVALLYVSDIINIVCEPSMTSLEAVHRWWSTFSNVISRGDQIVNIIVNKWIPGVDGAVAESLARYTVNGVVMKIPFDAAAHILTTRCELAILYREAGKLKSALTNMYKTLGTQMMKYIGVPRFKI